MDAEFEEAKTNLEREIERIDEHFANGWVWDEEAAVSLRAYRAECEDDIVQERAGRDLGIRLFRQRQGVWGDG